MIPTYVAIKLVWRLLYGASYLNWNKLSAEKTLWREKTQGKLILTTYIAEDSYYSMCTPIPVMQHHTHFWECMFCLTSTVHMQKSTFLRFCWVSVSQPHLILLTCEPHTMVLSGVNCSGTRLPTQGQAQVWYSCIQKAIMATACGRIPKC